MRFLFVSLFFLMSASADALEADLEQAAKEEACKVGRQVHAHTLLVYSRLQELRAKLSTPAAVAVMRSRNREDVPSFLSFYLGRVRPVCEGLATSLSQETELLSWMASERTGWPEELNHRRPGRVFSRDAAIVRASVRWGTVEVRSQALQLVRTLDVAEDVVGRICGSDRVMRSLWLSGADLRVPVDIAVKYLEQEILNGPQFLPYSMACFARKNVSGGLAKVFEGVAAARGREVTSEPGRGSKSAAVKSAGVK